MDLRDLLEAKSLYGVSLGGLPDPDIGLDQYIECDLIKEPQFFQLDQQDFESTGNHLKIESLLK